MKTKKWAEMTYTERLDRVYAVVENDEFITKLNYEHRAIGLIRNRLLSDPAYAVALRFDQGDEEAAQEIAEILCRVVNWRDCNYEQRHLWARVLTVYEDYEDVAWNVQCDIKNRCAHYADHYIVHMPDALVRIDDADLESVARDIAKLASAKGL